MPRKHLALGIVALAVIAFVGFWSKISESMRLASIRQSVRLTDATVMKVHDACVYPADAKHELLRIFVTYEGQDPALDYEMRAEIGRTLTDTTFKDIWQWHVGTAADSRVKFWEFQNFPRNGAPIFVRLFLRPKAGGPELVRVFQIPDRPRFTPNGELPHLLPTALAAR